MFLVYMMHWRLLGNGKRKCLAGRFGGSNDIEDIDILINVLNIQTYQQAIRIIEKFYDISEFSSGIREYLQMILH